MDIGVHQDGLVHISALADTFVKNPRSIVKTGDLVKVKVMEVDLNRKRISLSMRLTDEARRDTRHPAKSERPASKRPRKSKTPVQSSGQGTMSHAFATALKKK